MEVVFGFIMGCFVGGLIVCFLYLDLNPRR
jgi:hypothetical protein